MYFCVREEYGKICGFYLGSKSIVILSDLEMIKKVTKYYENFIKRLNLISHTGNIPFSLQKNLLINHATSIPINLFVEKEIVTPKPKEEAYIRYEEDFLFLFCC